MRNAGDLEILRQANWKRRTGVETAREPPEPKPVREMWAFVGVGRKHRSGAVNTGWLEDPGNAGQCNKLCGQVGNFDAGQLETQACGNNMRELSATKLRVIEKCVLGGGIVIWPLAMRAC